jgi:hypothetical protein
LENSEKEIMGKILKMKDCEERERLATMLKEVSWILLPVYR